MKPLISFFRNINSKEEKEFFDKLYNITKINAKSKGLYLIAFTHKSFQQKHNLHDNFERLEFVGDSVLNTIVSEILYKKYPRGTEGTLTEMRSKMVNRRVLDNIGYKMGLDALLRTTETYSKVQSHVLGNILEALIGAIYFDKGWKTAQVFIQNQIIHPHLDLNELNEKVYSYKNVLLNWAAKNRKTLVFEDSEINGPRNKAWFQICIKDSETDFELAVGIASSKKEASQIASEKAMEYLASKGLVE